MSAEKYWILKTTDIYQYNPLEGKNQYLETVLQRLNIEFGLDAAVSKLKDYQKFNPKKEYILVKPISVNNQEKR